MYNQQKSFFIRRKLTAFAGSYLPGKRFSSYVCSDPRAGPPSARAGLRSSEHACLVSAFLQLLFKASTPKLKDFTLCNKKIQLLT